MRLDGLVRERTMAVHLDKISPPWMLENGSSCCYVNTVSAAAVNRCCGAKIKGTHGCDATSQLFQQQERANCNAESSSCNLPRFGCEIIDESNGNTV